MKRFRGNPVDVKASDAIIDKLLSPGMVTLKPALINDFLQIGAGLRDSLKLQYNIHSLYITETSLTKIIDYYAKVVENAAKIKRSPAYTLQSILALLQLMRTLRKLYLFDRWTFSHYEQLIGILHTARECPNLDTFIFTKYPGKVTLIKFIEEFENAIVTERTKAGENARKSETEEVLDVKT